jgi:hypothetical protein
MLQERLTTETGNPLLEIKIQLKFLLRVQGEK